MRFDRFLAGRSPRPAALLTDDRRVSRTPARVFSFFNFRHGALLALRGIPVVGRESDVPESRRGRLELDAREPIAAFPQLPAHHHAADGFLTRHLVNDNDGIAGEHACFQLHPAAMGAHDDRTSVFRADGILGTLVDDLDGNIKGESRASAPRLPVGWLRLGRTRLRHASTVQHIRHSVEAEPARSCCERAYLLGGPINTVASDSQTPEQQNDPRALPESRSVPSIKDMEYG